MGQKTKGYQNLLGFPFSPELLKALDFVDQSLGKIVKKLQDVNLYDETLLIVASKHGQAPINPTLWKPVDPLIIKNGTKVAVDWQTVSCPNLLPITMKMGHMFFIFLINLLIIITIIINNNNTNVPNI